MSYLKESLDKIEPNKDIIPEHCLSFSEMSLYLEKINHDSVTDILESISEKEIKYLKENNELKSYNEADIEDLKDRLDLHFRDRWAGYKGFWESVIDKFDDTLCKLRPLDEINFSMIQENRVYGKIHDFIDYDKVSFAENCTDIIFNNVLDESSDLKKQIYGKNKIVGPVVEADSKYISKNWEKINESFKDHVSSAEAIKKFIVQESVTVGLLLQKIKSIDEKAISEMTTWLPLVDNSLATMHEHYANTMDSIYHNLLEIALIKSRIRSVDETFDEIDLDSIE